jgi:hypothetical protein
VFENGENINSGGYNHNNNGYNQRQGRGGYHHGSSGGRHSGTHGRYQQQRQAQENMQQQNHAQEIQLFLDGMLAPTLEVLDGFLQANPADKEKYQASTNSMVKAICSSSKQHIKKGTPDLLDIAKSRVQKFFKQRKGQYASDTQEREQLRVYVTFLMKGLNGDETPQLPSVRPREHNDRVVNENMTAIMGAAHEQGNMMQRVKENEAMYRSQQQNEANAYRNEHKNKRGKGKELKFRENDINILTGNLDKDRLCMLPSQEEIMRQSRIMMREQNRREKEMAMASDAQQTDLDASGYPILDGSTNTHTHDGSGNSGSGRSRGRGRGRGVSGSSTCGGHGHNHSISESYSRSHTRTDSQIHHHSDGDDHEMLEPDDEITQAIEKSKHDF